MADSEPELTLHIWPGKWGLQSMHADSLAAVLLLQLALPGKFNLAETMNPDVSPSGQLPYLTWARGDAALAVASLPAIVKYVAGVKRPMDGEESDTSDIDVQLNSLQRSQRVAWVAFVGAHLGDLVAYSFYALRNNYWDFTQPTLASMLPVPQRYYVPGRLRDMHKPRLEATGLWDVSSEDEGLLAKKKDNREEFKDAFAREKVLEKARTPFDILSKLLGDRDFFYHDRPTTLDVILAAHILLLSTPPFPNNLLQTLLTSAYPTLLAHARRVHAVAFDVPHTAQPRMQPPRTHSLTALLPVSLPWRASSHTTAESGMALVGGKKSGRGKTDEDRTYDRMRWGWYALTGLAIGGWLWADGIQWFGTVASAYRAAAAELDDDDDEDIDDDYGVDDEEADAE